MNWEMLMLDSEFGTPKMSKRKRIVVVIMFIVVLLFLFMTDDIQQRRFATLEKGYELMENGQYGKAITKFNEYLSIDSDLYWKLIEKANSYEYSRRGVKEAAEECREEMQSN